MSVRVTRYRSSVLSTCAFKKAVHFLEFEMQVLTGFELRVLCFHNPNQIFRCLNVFSYLVATIAFTQPSWTVFKLFIYYSSKRNLDWIYNFISHNHLKSKNESCKCCWSCQRWSRTIWIFGGVRGTSWVCSPVAPVGLVAPVESVGSVAPVGSVDVDLSFKSWIDSLCSISNSNGKSGEEKNFC